MLNGHNLFGQVHVSVIHIALASNYYSHKHFESNYSPYYSSDVIDARARLYPNGYSCNFSWLASKQSE